MQCKIDDYQNVPFHLSESDIEETPENELDEDSEEDGNVEIE